MFEDYLDTPGNSGQSLLSQEQLRQLILDLHAEDLDMHVHAVGDRAPEVIGRGKAYFYDRNLPVFPDQPDFVALSAGSRYDLAARTTNKDASRDRKPDASDADKHQHFK